MNVELDAATAKELELLAEAEGKDPEALLGELLHGAIAGRKRGRASRRDDEALAREQHEEWERLDRELSVLPLSQKAAAFSGRDHDEILYPRARKGWIFVDTGAWYAAFVPGDQDHPSAPS